MDTDTSIFPDQLLITGLKKKLFESRGMDAAFFQAAYNKLLDLAKSYDGGSPTLAMAPQPSSVLVGYENIPDTGFGY